MMTLRGCLVAALASAFLTTSPAVAEFPEKVVTLVVNSAPGGGADALARGLAEGLSREFGQRVIVENRAGAGGNVAAGQVARAPADGYTLLLADSGILAINPTLYGSLPFDPQKDFEPIARIAAFAIVVAANPSAGFKTLPELVAKAKAAPRSINYASTGVGSPQHLAAELLQTASGIELVHVPYRGGGPATVDLMAGHVPLGFIGIPPLAPAIQERKLVGLGVTGKARSPLLPEVPTVSETIPDFEAQVWFGLFAPKGTPSAVLDRINLKTVAVMRSDGMKEMLRRLGFDEFLGAAGELRTFMASEAVRWGDAVRRSGAKVE